MGSSLEPRYFKDLKLDLMLESHKSELSIRFNLLKSPRYYQRAFVRSIKMHFEGVALAAKIAEGFPGIINSLGSSATQYEIMTTTKE